MSDFGTGWYRFWSTFELSWSTSLGFVVAMVTWQFLVAVGREIAIFLWSHVR